MIGCGTSYNLALSIAATLNGKGFDALAVPAGEWLSRPNAYNNRQPSDLKVIKKSAIASHAQSPISPMPPGLLDGFSKEEIFQLLDFLQRGGGVD